MECDSCRHEIGAGSRRTGNLPSYRHRPQSIRRESAVMKHIPQQGEETRGSLGNGDKRYRQPFESAYFRIRPGLAVLILLAVSAATLVPVLIAAQSCQQ